MHGLVAVNFQLILKFTVDDGRQVGTRIGSKVQDQSNLSTQLGVQHWTVQTPIGRILIYKQRAVLALSPIVRSHHVASTLAETSCGLEKLSVASQVCAGTGVNQVQNFIGIALSSHQLLNAAQVEGLEGVGVLANVTIEGSGFHQTDYHHVGETVVKGVVDLVVPCVILDVVGPDLTSYRGVSHHLPSIFHTTHQFPVHRVIDFHLAEIQFQFDIFFLQTKGHRTRIPKAPKVGGVEVQFNTNLYSRDQELAEVKDFNVRHKAQHFRDTS